MARLDADVLILGAGAAGLSAAAALAGTRLRVILLEARNRIGGRMWTLRLDGWPWPVELGAEYVHGTPRSSWDWIERGKLRTIDLAQAHWEAGPRGLRRRDFYGGIERVLARLQKPRRDRSFDEFLAAHPTLPRKAREDARRYVRSFHAADTAEISERSLEALQRAGERLEEDRMSRLAEGQEALVRVLAAAARLPGRLRLEHPVARLRWGRGWVEAIGGGRRPFRVSARRAIVALPLGVLQAGPGEPGHVSFEPPPGKTGPLAGLRMGAVAHVVLRFHERLWEDRSLASRSSDDVRNAAFFHVPGAPFQVWWTQLPVRAPMLTGWVGGPPAAELCARGRGAVLEAALESVGRLLLRPPAWLRRRLAGWHFHDWSGDPYARGAYSYAAVGAADAARALAAPVAGTLFFAGEATHFEGENATVSGAIGSGRRAALEVLASLRR